MNPENIKIKSLKNLSIEQLYVAFKDAFADYEMQLNMNQLEKMLQRRGFNSELSFGAFDEDKLVAFTFNGIGKYMGSPTAYDTGTGTIKEYRGKGLAKQIFFYSIPFLKQAGVQQYLLEVLQHNESAYGLYKKIGFQVIREFDYYVSTKESVVFPHFSLNEKYAVKKDIHYQDISKNDFWDFSPSWQNNFEAISRQEDSFESLGIYLKNQLIAYSIFEPSKGDITQLAVHKDFRRLGLATNLFKFTLNRIITPEFQIINTDSQCVSMQAFLKSFQIQLSGKQFEMMKTFY